MAFQDAVFKFIAGLFFENPSKHKSFAQLRFALEQGSSVIESQLEVCKPNPELLRHIIAIEAWGQNRLRSSIGEVPFELDRSGKYAPDVGIGWSELRSSFRKTRQTTLDLLDRLEAANPTPVAHNQFGPISAKAWIWYLNTHANLEAKRKLRR
jgi:hypothetical protein